MYMTARYSCNLLFLASLFFGLATRCVNAKEYTSIIRYEPNGPGGKGLIGPNSEAIASSASKISELDYYKSPSNPRLTSGLESRKFPGLSHAQLNGN